MDFIPAADHDDEETQLERADRLAEILDDSGWDGMAAIHLIDCLAGTGLKLVPDPEGECSECYLELLQGDLAQLEAARADIAAGTGNVRTEILASPTPDCPANAGSHREGAVGSLLGQLLRGRRLVDGRVPGARSGYTGQNAPRTAGHGARPAHTDGARANFATCRHRAHAPVAHYLGTRTGSDSRGVKSRLTPYLLLGSDAALLKFLQNCGISIAGRRNCAVPAYAR